MAVTTQGVSGALAVDADGDATCALVPGSLVKCWGNNSFGGIGSSMIGVSSGVPITVNITNVTGLGSAHGAAHACAIRSDGTVWCWGNNDGGQLGDAMASGNLSSTPVRALGVANATAVAAGFEHTCALLSGGTVVCWGGNDSGQLGNGTLSAPVFTPATVSGLTGVRAIAAALSTTCALLSNGSVKCWGSNANGQLGDGTTNPSSSVPVSASGLSGVTVLSVSNGHACALLPDGTARCWGANSAGQLGNGEAGYAATPVAVLPFPPSS